MSFQKHNLLLTHPRTSSHLLTKILNTPAQPSVHDHPGVGYLFIPPTEYRFQHNLISKRISEWSDEDKEQMLHKFQGSYEDLVRWMRKAEALNKTLYIKEHVLWLVEPAAETHLIFGAGESLAEPLVVTLGIDAGPNQRRSKGNETCLPDAFLKRFNPTFLIRHPALAFPSLLRTALSDADKAKSVEEEIIVTAKWELTYHWSRALYDWYVSNMNVPEMQTVVDSVTWPVVLDADDITRPEVVEKYCSIAGLDYSKVVWEWRAVEGEERQKLPRIEQKMKGTILSSTGVVKGKTSDGLDIEKEKEKWIADFGDNLGKRMVKWTEDAMEDYEYLLSKRLTM